MMFSASLPVRLKPSFPAFEAFLFPATVSVSSSYIA
jgi:hypothetical protein